MLLDSSELKKIVARGEDSQHQFKEDIRNGDSLAAEMVAFSNSRGGAIFIGVSNKGALVGLSSKDVDRVNQLISNSTSQHVRSSITVHTENISIESGWLVIVVTIPEGIDKPYFDHQGVIWLKSGADKRRIQFVDDRDNCLFTSLIQRVRVQELPNKGALKGRNAPKMPL